jgi:hypothetical protein
MDWEYKDTFLGFLRNVRRVPWGREGLEKFGAPPPPPITAMDWFFEDMHFAFLRKKTGNEAMPSLHYLFLVQDRGRIVYSAVVPLRDLALISSVGLSDDMVQAVQLSDDRSFQAGL